MQCKLDLTSTARIPSLTSPFACSRSWEKQKNDLLRVGGVINSVLTKKQSAKYYPMRDTPYNRLVPTPPPAGFVLMICCVSIIVQRKGAHGEEGALSREGHSVPGDVRGVSGS